MTDNRNSIGRRTYLKALGATSLYGSTGCLGKDSSPASDSTTPNGTANETGKNESSEEDDQADTGPDIAMAERPFQYIVDPQELDQRGLIEQLPTASGEAIPAGYYNYRQMREGMTGPAWEKVISQFYPRVLIPVKYDLAEISSPEDVNYDDIDAAAYGKSADGLLKTTIGYDTMMAHMEERGFEQIEERNGWPIFEGTYVDGDKAPTDMRVALSGDFMAYVLEGGNDPYLTPYVRARGDRLDEFITTYVDLLAGDADYSLGEMNEYGRWAEQVFHSDDARDWDVVLSEMASDREIAEYRESGDPVPIAGATLIDFEGEEMFSRGYAMFESDEVEVGEIQSYPINP